VTLHICGNLTLDEVPVEDGFVGLQAQTSEDRLLTIRTLSTGTIPLTVPYVKLWNVTPCDFLGSPQLSFRRGTLAYFKINVSNLDPLDPHGALMTVNTYYNDSTPFGFASIQVTISPGSNPTFIISIPIPTDAVLGTTTAYANAYTNWPKNGGTPYCNEAEAIFEIIDYEGLGSSSRDSIVTSSTQADNNGSYHLTFKLPSNAGFGTYTVYVSSGYGGETTANTATFRLILISQTTVTIEGKEYTITIRSNATITNATATRNTLHFTSSGPDGEKAYINTTLPMELNKTGIKLFIDGTELVPPPYPIITTNGTHYFIYFEFTLSTHNIAIQYAIADIATTNITPAKTAIGQGYTTRINATIQNQGHYEEDFNVTIYANSTAIASQKVTLSSGNSTTIAFTWNTTGFAKGNYTISAVAEQVLGETDIDDNNCTDGWILIAKVGDLGGPINNAPTFFACDGVIDGRDLALWIQCYNGLAPPNAMYLGDLGSYPPQFFKCDGLVDGTDLALFIQCYNDLGPP